MKHHPQGYYHRIEHTLVRPETSTKMRTKYFWCQFGLKAVGILTASDKAENHFAKLVFPWCQMRKMLRGTKMNACDNSEICSISRLSICIMAQRMKYFLKSKTTLSFRDIGLLMKRFGFNLDRKSSSSSTT